MSDDQKPEAPKLNGVQIAQFIFGILLFGVLMRIRGEFDSIWVWGPFTFSCLEKSDNLTNWYPSLHSTSTNEPVHRNVLRPRFIIPVAGDTVALWNGARRGNRSARVLPINSPAAAKPGAVPAIRPNPPHQVILSRVGPVQKPRLLAWVIYGADPG